MHGAPRGAPADLAFLHPSLVHHLNPIPTTNRSPMDPKKGSTTATMQEKQTYRVRTTRRCGAGMAGQDACVRTQHRVQLGDNVREHTCQPAKPSCSAAQQRGQPTDPMHLQVHSRHPRCSPPSRRAAGSVRRSGAQSLQVTGLGSQGGSRCERGTRVSTCSTAQHLARHAQAHPPVAVHLTPGSRSAQQPITQPARVPRLGFVQATGGRPAIAWCNKRE